MFDSKNSSFYVFSFLLIFFSNIAIANNPWSLINKNELDSMNLDRQIIPNKYVTFSLNLDSLQNILNQAPLRFSSNFLDEQIILQIPMPNGQMQSFEIYDAPIMHPDLAARYPMIHSYAGIGLDDKTATIRFDVTQFGFHAMVMSAQQNTIFIDPYTKGNLEHYIVYHQKDFYKDVPFSCSMSDDTPTIDIESTSLSGITNGDGILRTYRLALACTGEYGIYHGGTLASVMAAVNTSMTRINGIFEREVGVSMQLLANNDEILFLDPSTDPFSDSDAAYPDENQIACDNIIGTENYDIGHVFGIGQGGAAQRSSCCVEGLKAIGASAISDPVGDPFDIEFVAHEFGHQFGCSHPYSPSCNTTKSTAFEPGSASTIMGTNFSCITVQSLRDDYFHAINILEINEHIQSGPASMCAVETNLGNTSPTVEAGESGYFLPVSTPFKLNAEGSDTDGDVLTYCWEQMNNEESIDPPLSSNGQGPAFRSFPPKEESFRYFPNLPDIVNGTSDTWEALPSVDWDMTFWVTARDNATGAGSTAQDEMSLKFTENAGPFLVQNPNTNTTWWEGANYTVTWDVADTDKSPVLCSHVDILLSLDGGYTYPIELASEVINDGAATVLIPENISTTTARVMVAAHDNLFFDISDTDFTISESSVASVVVAPNPIFQRVCTPTENISYDLTFSSLNGFTEELTLSTSNVPSGVTISFSQNNFIPPATVTMILEGVDALLPDEYLLNVTSASASTSVETEISFSVFSENQETVTLLAPLGGATNVSITPSFLWEDLGDDKLYIFELATNPAFGNNLAHHAVTHQNSYTIIEELAPQTVYYWRVRTFNDCGEEDISPTSDWAAFQTDSDGCRRFTNSTPVYIHGYFNSVSSTISIDKVLNITDANVSIEILHKNVGDLKATLTSPSGNSVDLFDRPGFPDSPFGCTRDNMLVTLDDTAPNSSNDLENLCTSGVFYGIEGDFQPINSLSNFNSESSEGNWVLTVDDEKFSHAGSVQNWSIEFCFDGELGETPSFSKAALNVSLLGTETILVNNLLASSPTNTTDQITYTILKLPTAGDLFLDGQTVTVGSLFTQADIGDNLLTYTHTDPNANIDQFRFNIETQDGGWIYDEFLDINIGMVNTFSLKKESLSFRLFPNPAEEFMTLELLQATDSDLDLKVYDVMGKIVKQLHIEKSNSFFQQKINTKDLPAGNYIVVLMDGHHIARALFSKI